jgi:hypothetical protein
MIGETGFEPATARPPAGCATRLRHSPWSSDDSPVRVICTHAVRVSPYQSAYDWYIPAIDSAWPNSALRPSRVGTSVRVVRARPYQTTAALRSLS